MHQSIAHGDDMTTTNSSRSTTLLLGGTGKTGRRVANRLGMRGLTCRIASRTGTPPFDWHRPETWTNELLRDVAAVYIAYAPDLAVPDAGEQIARFCEHAVARGVRRIVLLSGRGEPQVVPAEQAVARCGAEYTILRAAFMCQNFSEGFLADGVLAGEVQFPADQVAEPFVDADDVAEVAVAELVEDGHAGVTYDLTGPRLLTFAQATAELAVAAARPIAYRSVSWTAYAEMLGAFLPADQVGFFVELFQHVLRGHNAHVSGDVERVLGRPARDFLAFACEAASRWAA